MKMSLRAICAAALVCGSVPAAAAELILDGGFEVNVGVSRQYAAGQSIGAWTVTGGIPASNSVFLLRSDYSEPPLTFNAFQGNYALDITGAGNTVNGGVYQDVATQVNQAYQLSFYVGNAQSDPPTANSGVYNLQSTINGQAVTPFAATNAFQTPNGINWRQYVHTFTATSASTRISFQNGTLAGDNYAGLDLVSMVAVPEPGTWSMLIVGFGAVGYSMRRRRKYRFAQAV